MNRPNFKTCNRQSALMWVQYIEGENVRLQERIMRLESDVAAHTRGTAATTPEEDAEALVRRDARRTSAEAAMKVYPRTGTRRYAVLLAVAHSGQRGITRDELCAQLDLEVSTINPRTRELLDGGWLREDPERTRKTRMKNDAAVLLLTDKGYRAVTKEGYAVQEPPPMTSVPPELQASLLES